jgi:NADH-quinone oxidoreductase subunit J
METIIFYILSIVILVFSVLTVTTKKILRAAVYLLFVLGATAGIYFMFNYNFLAAVQLTVYAGGIVVLIIFSILLTHQINTNLDKINIKKIALGIISSGLGIFLVLSTLNNFQFVASNNQATDLAMEISSMHGIGIALLSYSENGYILPFEVISVLLLAAMIGAIVIAKKEEA